MAAPNLAALREQYKPRSFGSTNHHVDASRAYADVTALLDRIGELEETILGAAELLFPGGDWGPTPPGGGESWRSYVYECVDEQAAEIRDQWKARGWKRA